MSAIPNLDGLSTSHNRIDASASEFIN